MGKLRNRDAAGFARLGVDAIEAKEMGTALEVAARKLYEYKVLPQESLSILVSEAKNLSRKKRNKSWKLKFDRDCSIVFEAAKDKSGNTVYPRLFCAGIEVTQENQDLPPFTRLDVGIEVIDSEGNIISRWHVDLANKKGEGTQDGPLTHLQYGGHIQDQRELDCPIKVPRWCHPPMDLILLCEVVAANFYPNNWEEIREDKTWCEAVMCGQRLCYSAYINKLYAGIQQHSKTLLHHMWASEWCSI